MWIRSLFSPGVRSTYFFSFQEMDRQPHPELRLEPGVQPDGLDLDRRKDGRRKRQLDPQLDLRKVRHERNKIPPGESRIPGTDAVLFV